MNMKKIITFFIVLSLVVIGTFFYFLNQYKNNIYSINSKDAEEKIFTIENGQRAREVAANLKEENLIKNDFYFLVDLYLNKKQNNIQAGDYILNTSMKPEEIIEAITNGRTTAKKLTIIEGWNLKDVADALKKLNVSDPQDFYDIAGLPATDYKEIIDKPKNYSDQFSFLKDKPSWISLEGYLYPDTYYLSSAGTLDSAIKKALENFDHKLTPDLRNEIQKQGKTIFEIVTMASILEEEVKSIEDKKMVAGILYKRIEQNMPLQIDATTLYAQIKDDNSKVNTKYVSPYNTYLIRGLPLGPICNPSIDSIKAAIYPTPSNYLFYLSASDSGKTIFSRNFEEHKRAIQQYLK